MPIGLPSVADRRLRVGIDAHMVGSRETGNETYVKGLVEGLKAGSQDVEVVVYNVGSPWIQSDRRVRFQRLLGNNPFARLGIELPYRSLSQHLDVLHVTYAAPAWSAAPVVVTIHDICYVTNPEWFSSRDLRVLRTVVPRAIRKAAHVITDSDSARRQIMETYGVPEAKISAIPIGPGGGSGPITIDAAHAELAALGLSIDRPYILTVGNLQPRKNLIRLIEAYNTLTAASSHEIDLVIVGPRHYRSEEILQAVKPDSDRIHFTGYVSDRQLAACYRCSTAFVLPSLYEGFGLPVLEAMAHGIPVACSDAGALPGLCGDAAVLFDPKSADAIAVALRTIVGDQALRRRLESAGPARAQAFSWEKTARLTFQVYEKVGS